MRFLHTSDWHLGASTAGISRRDDHALFFRWLLASAEEHDADALIVAGDVFDTPQPSADAQRQFFEFLQAAGESRLRHVVMIAGNHDSPSRFEAPRALLASLNIQLIGALRQDDASWDQALCPLTDADGNVALVVAAVPYVHEYHLGVRGLLTDKDESRGALSDALRNVYTTLADRASERWPGVPMVATGHLTAEGVAEGDYGSAIHQAKLIGGLPATIFDPRFSHVALGHLHRCFQVGKSAAWYSGSPIPLRRHEMKERRHVLLVDTAAPRVADSTQSAMALSASVSPSEPDADASHAGDKARRDGGHQAQVTKLKVPTFRQLVTLQGDANDVARELVGFSSSEPLPALLFAEVEVETYEAQLSGRLELALTDRPSDATPLHLASVRQLVPSGKRAVDVEEAPALKDLSIEDVFVRLCRARGAELDEPLLAAFRHVASGPLVDTNTDDDAPRGDAGGQQTRLGV